MKQRAHGGMPRHESSNNPPKITAPQPVEIMGQKFADWDGALAAAEKAAQAGAITPADLDQIRAAAMQASGGKSPMNERDAVNNDVRAAIAQLMQQQGQQAGQAAPGG
jgi:hypothetical protein